MLGLVVHLTAGFFDPGFKGWPTLEMVNSNPVPLILYPGMKIAQMSVFEMVSASRNPYGEGTGAKYQNQSPAPVVSQYWKNFEPQEAQ